MKTLKMLFLTIPIFLLSCQTENDKTKQKHSLTVNTTTQTHQENTQENPKTDTLAEDLQKLKDWQAGQTVDSNAVEKFGFDNCFSSQEIPDAIWQKMQGKTYTENPHIKRSDLRHIRVLHWDYDQKIHIGEMICNQQIAQKVVNIFKELYQNKYPIEKMLLPEVFDADDEKQMQANNTSCFCYRNVPNSKTLSKHALGLAVDINTLYNPYITFPNGKQTVMPANADDYCDRTKDFKYKITENDLCVKLFRQNGFTWGGTWKSKTKDYQHFDIR